MSDTSFVNENTVSLRPYPMEELRRIKVSLLEAGKTVFDFGTGDPRIKTPPFVKEEVARSLPEISQYPSIAGSEELKKAHQSYLKRRLALEPSDDWMVIPSRGSKEAVFHIAQSLIGRAGGKNIIIYPTPGYPVYKSSTSFAGGIPYPVKLEQQSGYLLEPWTLDEEVQNKAAAIWLNYPHNPTGACAPLDYWKQVIEWCHKKDCVLLSDDCYLDIFDPKLDENPQDTDLVPTSPLSVSTNRVISFLSLSKRSGMTGYRAGMIAGDSRILKPHLRARANFGLGNPTFIQQAAVKAWNDDQHVLERRKIFDERLELATEVMKDLGLVSEKPKATFYLWCKVPESFKDNDVDFCLSLAKQGMITSPSQWLGEGIKGYFRLAMVPDLKDTRQALEIFKRFIENHKE